jgi:hypothetical protein
MTAAAEVVESFSAAAGAGAGRRRLERLWSLSVRL